MINKIAKEIRSEKIKISIIAQINLIKIFLL